MDQSQERMYSFQTRVFTTFRCNAAYIPGMPTMIFPQNGNFETVAGFVLRYNKSRRGWESSASSGNQGKLGITKENLRKLDKLEIPKGVNPNSWIKPSEEWFKANLTACDIWESKIKEFRGGEEIIEAKALSDAFINDPDSDIIHVTQHEKNPGPDSILVLEPTLGNGPSQPVLPPGRAQQSLQPSLNTADFLLAKPNSNPDLQRHSKLNDDPITPSASSSMSQSSMSNDASPLLPQSNGNQQIVHPAANIAVSSSVTPVRINHRRSRSVLNDDPINPSLSFLIPPQTSPGNSNPSSATQGATTRPVNGGNSSTSEGINR